MAKDTFYFSHDYNSRSDEKIKRLIRKHGMQGYGIFWSIVEDLYNNTNVLQMDFEGIAYEYRVGENIIESIINEFDLFIIDGETFGSLSVQSRLDKRDNISKKARESALKRWGNKANAKQEQCVRIDNLCEGNAIKERKGNETKLKHNTTAKSYDYAREKAILNNVSNLFDSKFYDTEKKKANWLNTIRLLHHTDNFSYEKIEAAIRFARADDFWKDTFISIPTLRKKKDDIMKIDKIIAKMPKAEHRAGKIKLYEPR